MQQDIRFSSLMWYERMKDDYSAHFKNVLVVGAGGTGSWLTLFLHSSGFKPHVMDGDSVENHNIGSQFYGLSDIGDNKCQAVTSRVKELRGGYLSYTNSHFNENTTRMANIVFCAVDSMEVRKLLFRKWLDKNYQQGLFIDSRLAAEVFTVYSIKANDTEVIEKYKATLFDDEQASEELCTAQQTTHFSSAVAFYMTNNLTSYVTNYYAGVDVRVVPFKIEFKPPFHELIIER